MSRSRSGKPDPDLERVELLFHQKGGSASFGTKMALSLNGVDPSHMSSITGFTCRAKCSNILHDIETVLQIFIMSRDSNPGLLYQSLILDQLFH